jgi:hypothetical protein
MPAIHIRPSDLSLLVIPDGNWEAMNHAMSRHGGANVTKASLIDFSVSANCIPSRQIYTLALANHLTVRQTAEYAPRTECMSRRPTTSFISMSCDQQRTINPIAVVLCEADSLMCVTNEPNRTRRHTSQSFTHTIIMKHRHSPRGKPHRSADKPDLRKTSSFPNFGFSVQWSERTSFLIFHRFRTLARMLDGLIVLENVRDT